MDPGLQSPSDPRHHQLLFLMVLFYDCVEMVFGTGDKEDPPSKQLKKQRGFKRISGKRKPNEQQLRKQQLRGKWASF